MQNRTVDQLRAKYENLKNQARKYASDLNRERLQTGGGSVDLKINVIMEKVLTIINAKTVYGEGSNFDDDHIESRFVNDKNT